MSKQIPQLKKAGEDTTAILADMKELSAKVAQLNARREDLEADLENRLLHIPNLPSTSSPLGESEADNPVVRSWGEIPNFDFKIRDHVDIDPVVSLYLS